MKSAGSCCTNRVMTEVTLSPTDSSHGFPIPARRNDRSSAAGSDGVLALAGVECAISGDAGDLLIRRDLVDQFKHGRVAHSADVNSAAGISWVCSPILWILRQARRFVQSCLNAFHSPSPSTLIPVLSIKMCSGPCEAR